MNISEEFVEIFKGMIGSDEVDLDIYYDIQYTSKAIASVMSGLEGLEIRDEYGHFHPVKLSNDSFEYCFRYDPFYVCVKFADGNHIPLPLIINPEGPEQYPIQSKILSHFDKLGMLDDAKKACLQYLILSEEFDESTFYYDELVEVFERLRGEFPDVETPFTDGSGYLFNIGSIREWYVYDHEEKEEVS